MAKKINDDQFKIKVWGARGSLPAPGPKTIKYGGNTSCLEVRCGDELIILDAGSGLRPLGEELMNEMPFHATILLSHAHWDHIQGFPFFRPAFISGNSFKFYGEKKMQIEVTLKQQMMYPNFPVTLDEMDANIHFVDLRHKGEIEFGNVNIEYGRLNHPGGVTSFRINYKNKAILYATDTEHYSCLDQNLLRLAKDVDILFYDANYNAIQYKGEGKGNYPKTGWGHSTLEAGAEIAKAANVKKLILWHHDPGNDDNVVASMEKEAQALFPETCAAYEGMEIDLLK